MEKNAVQTLDRALDIVELLSLQREGLGVTDIGSRLSLHKSTVHRLLNSLAERGYIEKVGAGTYKLGLKFLEIVSLRLNNLELKTEAAPSLRLLADTLGQVVHLAILDGAEAVYIDKMAPVSSIRMYSQIGRRIPLHCTALGKAMLSQLPLEERDSLIAKLALQRFTATTHTTPAELIADLESVRRKGWSVDDEEHEDGVRCVAAPVMDYSRKVIAAISVSGDSRIIAPERDPDTAAQVRFAAGIISKRMGYVREVEP